MICRRRLLFLPGLALWVLPMVSWSTPAASASSAEPVAAAAASKVAPRASGGLRLRIVDRDLAGRIFLSASWPMGTGDPEIRVKVDGREVHFDRVGAGHGDGRELADLAVVPNAFGRMRIEVIVTQDGRTRRARVTTRFRPAAAVLPDWVDSELVVGARALRFDFRHARIAEVRLNGAPAEFGMEKNIPADRTTYSVAILAMGYRPGVNTVSVVAVDWSGETRTWTSSIYYTPDGAIEPGAVFNLMYGLAGSRSGPFYRVTTDATLLEELADRTLPDGKLVKTYRARGAGSVTITIEKKAHFRGPYEIERTIALRITG